MPGGMTDWETSTIDLLDLLDANVDRIAEALEGAAEQTPYIEGQLAYLRALDDRLEEVGEDAVPSELLESVAADLGIEIAGGDLVDPVEDDRQAGVLGMWALCLGYVEGAADGIRAAMGEIGDVEGVSTRTEDG